MDVYVIDNAYTKIVHFRETRHRMELENENEGSKGGGWGKRKIQQHNRGRTNRGDRRWKDKVTNSIPDAKEGKSTKTPRKKESNQYP